MPSRMLQLVCVLGSAGPRGNKKSCSRSRSVIRGIGRRRARDHSRESNFNISHARGFFLLSRTLSSSSHTRLLCMSRTKLDRVRRAFVVRNALMGPSKHHIVIPSTGQRRDSRGSLRWWSAANTETPLLYSSLETISQTDFSMNFSAYVLSTVIFVIYRGHLW